MARFKKQLETASSAHAQGRREDVAAFAHWLKGAGGTVGFDALTAPAARLEQIVKTGGSDTEIEQAIGDLQGLSARLVDPGNPSGGALPAIPIASTPKAAPPPGKVTCNHLWR